MPVKTFFLLSAILYASSACSQTQDSAPPERVFKVNVNLVVIDAQVLKKKTHQPVPSLGVEDFSLFENGMKQEIASLSQDELPLSIVFLFDLTDSVRPVLESLAGGALQALQHLKPEDKAAVMVYSASTRLLQDFTTDRELVARAIRKASRMESGEAAFFNEAIFQAADQAAKAGSNDRRVILWLTDNVPNIPSEEVRRQYGRSVPEGSLHTEKDAIAELFKTGTAVFTLLQRSEISDSEFMRHLSDSMFVLSRLQYPPGDVYKYTQQTGGEVVESYSTKKVALAMAGLIDQIRTRYALGYHPPDDASQPRFRTIRLEVVPEVQTREGKLIVETKKGYYR
jgi:VWFA-related protein